MPFTAQPTEKCSACNLTVYLTEKVVVEEKTDKRVFHKQCIRCQVCNKVLLVGQYSSMDGKFWCKPHFKQLFASKGNYDEPFGKEKRKDTSASTSTPTSFIPEVKSDAKSEKKATSDETVAKFRKFREEGDSDKCTACSKTVYLAEKLIVEDKSEKRLFHKGCFKCATCDLKLDLRNYGSLEGKIYCKNHLKEAQKINTPSNPTVTSPASFIPEVKEERKAEKGETPDHIASKFKGMSSNSEKCKACGKTVYATERATLTEGHKQQVYYHKTCLKCSVCSVKLDVSNYGIANGVLFCQVHLKQFGKPEKAKDNSYFVSPLATVDASYSPGPRESENTSTYDDDNRSSNRNEQVERNDEREENRDDSRDDSREENREESREESREEEREEVRESNYVEEKPQPTSQERNEISSSNDDDDDKKREDARQRRREERQKQMELEERQQEEEREKRKKEREARLKDLSDSTGGSSESATGGDDDKSGREKEREERRKKREEERKREEEERLRDEEKRKKEREERRRQQEELAKQELEEQERKAEERRRKLEELKNST